MNTSGVELAEEEDTKDDSVAMLLSSLLCSIFNKNGCGSRFVFCWCRRRTVAEPRIFKFQILGYYQRVSRFLRTDT